MVFTIVLLRKYNIFHRFQKKFKLTKKVIIDIKSELKEFDITLENYHIYKDFFNLMIYIKIFDAVRHKRDIFYVPHVLDLNNLIKMKEILPEQIKFKLIVFNKEFFHEPKFKEEVNNRLNEFDDYRIILNKFY